MTPRLLADVRPLRESAAFRRLWAGSAISAIGSAMTGFAIVLQVFRLTGSSAAVGAVGLAVGVPVLAVGLFGGSFADAMDRRSLTLITSALLAGVSIVLALQAFLGLDQLWLLYLLATVGALVAAVDAPARRTFVTQLLPTERVPAGVALNQLSFQLSATAGPALAGLVVAGGGLRLCYVIDAVSFAAALYGLLRMPPVPASGALRPGLRATLDGLSFVRRHPVLSAAFLADLDAMVLGMPIALFPAVNAEHFGGSARTLGLLGAAPAVGGVLGSALSGRLVQVRRPGRTMLGLIGVWGAGVAGFGLSATLGLALACLVIAGAADSTSVILRASLVQVVTPDELRGRVTGVDYVVGAGGPQLGNVRAGAVAAWTSPTISAVGGGLATILGAALIAARIPALRQYDSRPDSPTTPW